MDQFNNPLQVSEIKHFSTRNQEVYKYSDLRGIFNNFLKEILNSLEEFQESGSGWALKEILTLIININKYEPLHGGYFVNLPEKISRSNSVLNINSNDRKCFVWCIMAAVTNIRSTNYLEYPQNYHDFINMQNIELPVSIKDISKFEKNNSNISLSIYGWNRKKETVIGPLYHTKLVKQHHINLLYLSNGNNRNHFCYIYDLSKLISSQINKAKVSKYVCNRCLCYFHSEEHLERHMEDCSRVDPVKIILPSKDSNILKFTEIKKTIKVPFIIYADFECLTIDIQNCEPCNDSSFSLPYQKHEPYSVVYQVVCSFDENLSRFQPAYRGKEPIKWFVSRLREECAKISTILRSDIPLLNLSNEDRFIHENAVRCKICDCIFAENNWKVIDHDHLTGKYRGTLCNNCNLQCKTANFLPVVFHNLSSYDLHYIIKCLDYDDEPISIVPITSEKYLCVSKKCHGIYLKFIDSIKFLPASLSELQKSLNLEQFRFVRKEFPNNEQFELICRKGVFPYDYVNEFSKLNETELPAKEKFYNKLTDENISDEDYSHALLVWNQFRINTLGEYSDLYAKLDVLLLTDIFENYREFCLENYQLDVAHFVSAASFSWSAMLKLTKIQLELLTDNDMILFVEKGIRGGLVNCSHRYAIANNRYMHDFDASLPESYIMYFDANNLYGFAMSNPLPVSHFEWEHDIEKVKLFLSKASSSFINDNGISDECVDELGYILEVTVKYPEYLHDNHRDLPLLPHHYPDNKYKKLTATFYKRKKYVCHYKLLAQAISFGLELETIHRVLRFRQSRWLKPYIDFNTRLRAQAKTKFHQNLYKLKNNIIFGKTMENIRNHRIVKLATSWDGRYGARNLISRSNFHSLKLFNENLIAIELNKTELEFNKPIYVGMSILDISKCLMYDFHYNYFKNLSNVNSLKLLYMDTDSLLYFVECEDFYSIIRRDNDKYFDTSDYPEQNRYNITKKNKKKLGYLKDEANGQILKEFVGLKSKMYSIKFYSDECCKDIDYQVVKKKAKGIGKTSVKQLTFENYKEALFDDKIFYSKFRIIQSKLHDIYSFIVNKKSLNNTDDKRQILDDKVSTLPWGYKSEE